MAEAKKSFELDTLERGWIKQAIMNQVRMLTRSRNKEITGGAVWKLRGDEIDFLNALVARF